MKALTKKLLPLTVFAIAVTSLLSVQPVQAFTITMEEVGSNVVAIGSGAINLTGLSLIGFRIQNGARVVPDFGIIVMGTTVDANIDVYSPFSGPTNFGDGGGLLASSGSGDRVGIVGPIFQGDQIFVPQDYLSGNALSDNMIFNNQTFASLGVTPGTYVWTWGTGLPNQNFTLIIRGAGIPDGGSTVMLLGAALGALGMARRFLKA